MKTFWKILLLVLLLAAALVGGYFGYQALSERFAPSAVPAILPSAPGQEAPPVTRIPDPAGSDAPAPGLDDGRRVPGESGAFSPADRGDAPAATAADFTVQDWNGNDVNLSDYFGKPIVLNFWASWCGPCVGELPGFQTMYETYGEDVTFLMVNLTDGVDETVAGVKSFVDSNGYSFPVYFDVDYDGAITYGISSIPQTYFISASGEVVGSQLGSMDESTLEANILSLLAQ